eukprot:Seg1216.4 transcript_id=Seg1216.4/GoldUCD/mRNA.D3Y31 product="hypothetical protein" protein_id=Seg1216.4/GoldUCD/D3Y31
MAFFNDVTREIYESAYSYKQTQFNSYLNGQRLFRWDVMQNIESIKTVVCSYDEGVIPKENISFERYLVLPVDPEIKDLSLASRASTHIIATKQKIDQLLTQLQKRKTELFNSQMELKKWAANENSVISRFLLTLNELCVKVTALENDVSHTVKGLTKRFGNKSLADFEKKIRKQRQREQRSKNKRKQKMVVLRQARLLLKESKFVEDDLVEVTSDEESEDMDCTDSDMSLDD